MCVVGEFQDDLQTMRGGWMLTDSDNNQADAWQVNHLDGCNALYLDGHLQWHRRIEPQAGTPAYGFQYGLPPYPAALHQAFETLVIPAGKTSQQAWEQSIDPSTGRARGQTWGHTATVQRVQ
jgi:prepilin-type processing-associated H-X9-DG protein